MRTWTVTRGQALQILLVAVLAWGCSGRKVDMDTSSHPEKEAPAAQPRDPRDVKIDSLSDALSRAQSRIEELDAKVAALADKTDATRIAVDNISGSKAPPTEAVGSARKEGARAKAVPEDTVEGEKAVIKAKAAEGKSVLQMEDAIVEFGKAMTLFKNGRFADAELGFNHLTEQYPEHVLAGSAQFFSGESYFMMGEYKLALNEYQKVVASFGSSPRVASAIVRMAHCYTAIGNSNEAARTMSLARETFDGNPSLDWPAPVAKETKEAKAAPTDKKSQLDAQPIEPAEKPSAH
jgi:TolA-binding protein